MTSLVRVDEMWARPRGGEPQPWRAVVFASLHPVETMGGVVPALNLYMLEAGRLTAVPSDYVLSIDPGSEASHGSD